MSEEAYDKIARALHEAHLTAELDASRAREAKLVEATARAYQDGAAWMRGAAAMALDPIGPRPCDCWRCNCGNVGSAEAVAAWDADRASAQLIRSLPLPPPYTTAEMPSDVHPQEG